MKGVAKITSAELLAALMEENGLTQSQLAHEIGCHQENISAFLSGKRGLSKAVAIKLADRFKVTADLFLREHNTERCA